MINLAKSYLRTQLLLFIIYFILLEGNYHVWGEKCTWKRGTEDCQYSNHYVKRQDYCDQFKKYTRLNEVKANSERVDITLFFDFKQLEDDTSSSPPEKMCLKLFTYDSPENWRGCKNPGSMLQSGLSRVVNIRPQEDCTMIYRNLSLGLYCLKFGFSVVDIDEEIHLFDCILHKEFNISEEHSASAVQVSTSPEKFNLVPITILAVLLVVILIGTLYFLIKYNRRTNQPLPPGPEEKLSLLEAISTFEREAPSVFLLYSHESKQFEDLMNKLVDFLQLTCNIKVRYDMASINEILRSGCAWIGPLIEESQKIVIVNSRGVYLQYQAILNKHVWEPKDFLDQAQQQALSSIVNNPNHSFDYKNVFMTRFYFTHPSFVLQNICPNVHLLLPDDLPKLVCYLHDLDAHLYDHGGAMAVWTTCPKFVKLQQAIDLVAQQTVNIVSQESTSNGNGEEFLANGINGELHV